MTHTHLLITRIIGLPPVISITSDPSVAPQLMTPINDYNQLLSHPVTSPTNDPPHNKY